MSLNRILHQHASIEACCNAACEKRLSNTLRCILSTLRAICVLVIAVFFGGCGGQQGPERVVVSGTVTYSGKPITDGAIRFVPVSTSPVPVSGTTIVDGKYRADGKGGVVAGTYQIQIEAFRKVKISFQSGQPTPPNVPEDGMVRQQYLPKCYNIDSQLRITIEPGSGEITKDVDID